MGIQYYSSPSGLLGMEASLSRGVASGWHIRALQALERRNSKFQCPNSRFRNLLELTGRLKACNKNSSN